MLNKYQIDCAGCGKSTIVLTRPEESGPEFCPICSHPLTNPLPPAGSDEPEEDPL